MRILLTGANGFIGSHLLAGLEAAGHTVIPAVRRPDQLRRPGPSLEMVAIDLNRDVEENVWLPRLAGIDAVVNCAGVLQQSPGQSIDAIHVAAPVALFKACVRAGVRRVIQISAISADAEAGTAYAITKLTADRFLQSTDLDWVIVRPSLVVASGAFGGTALLRALAALPGFIPVVGNGAQPFQPIHMSDVVACVVHLVAEHSINRIVVDPVGPDAVTMRQVLIDLRAWLGFAPVPVLSVPHGLIAAAARAGDVLGGPLNSTSLAQLEYGNTGDAAAYRAATGLQPAGWVQALRAHPAQWQDRWQARLYFLRPMLRWMLALLWLISGVVGFLYPPALVGSMAAATGLPGPVLTALALGGCVLDIAIGVLLILRWRPGAMAAVQLVTTAAYTVLLTWAMPLLWLDPFGPLLKNLPIAAAVVVLAALEQDR